MPTHRKSSSRKTTNRKSSATTGKSGSTGRRAGTAKRERISPRGDTRYVRRDATGQFKESDDAGRSLSADRRRKAKTRAKPGYRDRGDR